MQRDCSHIRATSSFSRCFNIIIFSFCLSLNDDDDNDGVDRKRAREENRFHVCGSYTQLSRAVGVHQFAMKYFFSMAFGTHIDFSPSLSFSFFSFFLLILTVNLRHFGWELLKFVKIFHFVSAERVCLDFIHSFRI